MAPAKKSTATAEEVQEVDPADVAAEAIVPATGKPAKIDKEGRPETSEHYEG